MQNLSIYINATDLLATFCFNLHLASSLSHYHKIIYYSFFLNTVAAAEKSHKMMVTSSLVVQGAVLTVISSVCALKPIDIMDTNSNLTHCVELIACASGESVIVMRGFGLKVKIQVL